MGEKGQFCNTCENPPDKTLPCGHTQDVHARWLSSSAFHAWSQLSPQFTFWLYRYFQCSLTISFFPCVPPVTVLCCGAALAPLGQPPYCSLIYSLILMVLSCCSCSGPWFGPAGGCTPANLPKMCTWANLGMDSASVSGAGLGREGTGRHDWHCRGEKANKGPK